MDLSFFSCSASLSLPFVEKKYRPLFDLNILLFPSNLKRNQSPKNPPGVGAGAGEKKEKKVKIRERNKPRIRRRRSKSPINSPCSTRPSPSTSSARIRLSITITVSSCCSGTSTPTPAHAPTSATATAIVMARGRRPGFSIAGIVLKKGRAGISLVEGGWAKSATRWGFCYCWYRERGAGTGLEMIDGENREDGGGGGGKMGIYLDAIVPGEVDEIGLLMRFDSRDCRIGG